MNDDLLIVSPLDQPLQTDENWILDRVDEVIQQSVEKRNAYIALNFGKQIIQAAKISGLALAKLLYAIKDNWENYDIEEPFEDIVYVDMGLHSATVTRYVEVYEIFAQEKVPEQFEAEIKQRNIKDIIPIAKAIKQGYEIEDEEWKKLVDAPDFNTVAKTIREDIKHEEPRKSALMMFEDEIGTLYAWKNGNRYFVGSLEVESDEEVVQQAIERIRKGAGVMKK